MKNFFQLIAEIEVKTGTKVRFQEKELTYNAEDGTWRDRKEARHWLYQAHCCEKGWTVVESPSSTLVGRAAMHYLQQNPGKAIRTEKAPNLSFYFNDGFRVKDSHDNIAMTESLVYFFDGTEFEVIGS